MPSKQSRLQASGARAVFWAFNDSSSARLYLYLAKEVGDVSAEVETERRSQHEEWRLHTTWPFAMIDSQSPQKKTNHKSTVSRNNVHTTVKKNWRQRHYKDQRNKSKWPQMTMESNNLSFILLPQTFYPNTWSTNTRLQYTGCHIYVQCLSSKILIQHPRHFWPWHGSGGFWH